MRPDLSDVLSGVQRLLQTEVAPALSDPFVQEQLVYAGLLLEYVKSAWPGEHLTVAAESADLAGCLAAIVAPLEAVAGEAGRDLAGEIRAALLAEAAPVAERPLDRVLALDRERRALLERAIALLDTGGGDAAEAARQPIDAYLLRASGRRDAVLRRLGIIW